MKKIDLITMGLDKFSNTPVVFLKIEKTNLAIPLWIGPAEASYLALAIKNEVTDRPLTHELINSFVTQVGYTFNYIIIDDFKNNIYYSKIFINGEKELSIDSRPSDALILSVKYRIPIFVEDKVAFENSVDISFMNIEDAKRKNIEDFINNFNIDELKKKFKKGDDI